MYLFQGKECTTYKINMVQVQIQLGLRDCGLFAIAYAVQLAKRLDPAGVQIAQSQIRPHLINCFGEGRISLFPSKS